VDPQSQYLQQQEEEEYEYYDEEGEMDDQQYFQQVRPLVENFDVMECGDLVSDVPPMFVNHQA